MIYFAFLLFCKTTSIVTIYVVVFILLTRFFLAFPGALVEVAESLLPKQQN